MTSPRRNLALFTPEEARQICQHRCQALCCRGPAYLYLTRQETALFKEQAARLNAPLLLSESSDGAILLFPDHPGESCPMLGADFSCRIYPERPLRCRAFPERPTPGCQLSGASDD